MFKRGQREEATFAELLRGLGFEVREYSSRLLHHDGSDSYVLMPWDQEFNGDLTDVTELPFHIARATALGQEPRQYTFLDHENHFGGSADGQLLGMAPDPGLLEYKTHGEKSFIDLAGKLEDWRKHVTDPAKNPFTGKGLISSKIEHYVQMQVYMRYLGLSWGLYCAVNKNTDDLYFEVVQHKPEISEAYADRARQIIYSPTPPARLSQDPSWWECKFCDFREICHRGAPAQVNCRSCLHAFPRENGTWLCDKYHQFIPPEFIEQGCGSWESIAT